MVSLELPGLWPLENDGSRHPHASDYHLALQHLTLSSDFGPLPPPGLTIASDGSRLRGFSLTPFSTHTLRFSIKGGSDGAFKFKLTGVVAC